jgi:hypothetical protein
MTACTQHNSDRHYHTEVSHLSYRFATCLVYSAAKLQKESVATKKSHKNLQDSEYT